MTQPSYLSPSAPSVANQRVKGSLYDRVLTVKETITSPGFRSAAVRAATALAVAGGLAAILWGTEPGRQIREAARNSIPALYVDNIADYLPKE